MNQSCRYPVLWFSLIATFVFGSVHFVSAEEENDVRFTSLQRRISEVFHENAAALVRIKAAGKEGEQSGKTPMRVGTGFIISRDGHILTNTSVVIQAEHIWAEYKDAPYPLEVVGHDPSTNISLLRFITLPKSFSIIPLDNGGKKAEVTTFVLGITMPLEFDPTPSWGMINGRESYFGNRFFPVTYLRTSIPTAPGAGGAPVFDLQGQFIGIVVASVPEIFSSYVLPARALLRVRDELLFTGRMKHAFLGIEINEENGMEFGRRITVTDILKGGPADQAGIHKGDILLEFSGEPIERFHDFVDAVFFVRPGQEVSIVVKRGDERIATSMKILDRSEITEKEEKSPLEKPESESDQKSKGN